MNPRLLTTLAALLLLALPTRHVAAQRDYISAVINPEETRAKVVQSFKFLEGKTSSDVIVKKHGNIPL